MSSNKIVKFQEIIDFAYVTFGSMCRADYHNTFLCNCESALANGTVYPEIEMDIQSYFNILYLIKITHSVKAESFKWLGEYILSMYSKPIVDSLQPHQRRVVVEHAEYVDRINKLQAFIDGPIYKGVDIDEQDRLSKQLVIMVQLRDILAQRIEAFNK